MNKQTESKAKIDKQTKYSINYFLKTDLLKFIGGGVLIAGLFCLWLGFRLGLIGYILAILGSPTGLVLFLVGSTGKANDDDMDATINSKMAGLQIDIDKDRHYQLKLLKHQKEYTVEGYRYGEGVFLKKMKSGSLRTSLYCRAKLRILKDSLYIVARDISLIAEDKTETLYEIPYDTLKTVEILRSEERVIFNKTTFFTHPCYLHLAFEDQEIHLPAADAVTSDELVEAIKKQIKFYNDQKVTE